MQPTGFDELDGVLERLVARLGATLGPSLVGVYLQGSFAVGDADEHSDCDFIIVTADELTPAQVESLQVMHGQIYDLGPEWAKHLEGSYFARAVLRDPGECGRDLWYLDNGSRALIRDAHCNSLHVRWIVRERGVVLFGPPPTTLLEPIAAGALRQEMYERLQQFGRRILERPSDWSNRFYQGFIVLNFCRVLHDIHRGYPGSKRAGAAWAKEHLGPRWRALIDGAWQCRPDPAWQVRQPADPEAYAMALTLVEHIMELSTRAMKEDGGVRERFPV